MQYKITLVRVYFSVSSVSICKNINFGWFLAVAEKARSYQQFELSFAEFSSCEVNDYFSFEYPLITTSVIRNMTLYVFLSVSVLPIFFLCDAILNLRLKLHL